MPDRILFEVLCKGCDRSLVTVRLLRDPEIAVLVDHLRACPPSEPLGNAPMLGEIMRGIRVMRVDHPTRRDLRAQDGESVTTKEGSR
jgi:hypothetical protein